MTGDVVVESRAPLFHRQWRSIAAALVSLVALGLAAIYIFLPTPEPSVNVVYAPFPLKSTSQATSPSTGSLGSQTITTTLVRSLVTTSGEPSSNSSASLVFVGPDGQLILRGLDPSGRRSLNVPGWATKAVVKVRESGSSNARIVNRTFPIRRGLLHEVLVNFPARRAPIVAPFYFATRFAPAA
jgi:hypothetical protein